VAWSRRITRRPCRSHAAGKGLLVVEGKLIENLHVESAKRLVASAEQIDAMRQDLAG